MKGQKTIYPFFDGKYMVVTEQRDDSALPFIHRRIAYHIPIETIDVEEMLKVINYIRVKPNRNCTPEEVCQMVEQIKALLTEAVMKMQHHERYMYEREGGHNDTKRP